MDSTYEAYNLFSRGKYSECSGLCDKLLASHPHSQTLLFLKMRSMTKEIYVDELEVDVESVADVALDTAAIRRTARQTAVTNKPMTQSGRPVTGFARQETSLNRSKDLKTAMKSRMRQTRGSSRPFTASTGRLVRMATASSVGGKLELNISRMDLAKLCLQRDLSKAVFEHLFYFESDIRNALALATKADSQLRGGDWWWKVQMGKCYYRLGMFGEAETELTSALELSGTIDVFLYLSKLFTRIGQPTKSKEMLNSGLKLFPNDVSLMTWLARIDQDLGAPEVSSLLFRAILKTDATHVESISCIAAEYFYDDNPQVALKLYRRLLHMGVETTEVYCNIGLCCFMAQDYDLVYNCFERSLALADDTTKPDIYYNLGMLGLYSGDISFAKQCFTLATVLNPNHVESLNNLGVVEIRGGTHNLAYSHFSTAAECGLFSYEPFYNIALIAHKEGEFQTARESILKSLSLNSRNYSAGEILEKLEKVLMTI